MSSFGILRTDNQYGELVLLHDEGGSEPAIVHSAGCLARAKRIFVRYRDVGMAVVGPLLIGTQFAATIAVSLRVSVWWASIIQS